MRKIKYTFEFKKIAGSFPAIIYCSFGHATAPLNIKQERSPKKTQRARLWLNIPNVPLTSVLVLQFIARPTGRCVYKRKNNGNFYILFKIFTYKISRQFLGLVLSGLALRIFSNPRRKFRNSVTTELTNYEAA